tara:strand:+ start:3035 stop:3730 length:696 start_codon:yes stop_codon:yes gene_type:complete
MVDFLKGFKKTFFKYWVAPWAPFMLIVAPVFAGPTDDNHIHVEQLNGGDNVELNLQQLGYGNTINFSFDHANNEFNITQYGVGNSVSWVSYWGSGKNWGGDVDGSGNTETVVQYDGATYGRHIWGNNNEVDIYQSGDHTHNLDIHVDGVTHEGWQEGTGTHYSHVYFYGTSDDSVTDVMQKGSGNHNAQIRLQGTEHTTLNLLQQGSTNQSYTLTQNCYTAGGCTVNVTQQ